MYAVYAIYNKKHKKIYIGQTEDLARRIAEHNDPHCERHTYTRRFDGVWEVLYKESCATRKDALIREKQLKSYQGRQYIKKLIPL